MERTIPRTGVELVRHTMTAVAAFGLAPKDLTAPRQISDAEGMIGGFVKAPIECGMTSGAS